MDTEKRLKNIENRILRVERDVKKIKRELQLGGRENPLNWDELNDVDKQIIKTLLGKGGTRGLTTTELAEITGQENIPSGRVIMWRRLKQIVKKSRMRTGYPLVLLEHRRWHMNYDDFIFSEHLIDTNAAKETHKF